VTEPIINFRKVFQKPTRWIVLRVKQTGFLYRMIRVESHDRNAYNVVRFGVGIRNDDAGVVISWISVVGEMKGVARVNTELAKRRPPRIAPPLFFAGGHLAIFYSATCPC